MQLARDGVAQSVALLKNDAGVLPLDASKVRMALVMGVNTNTSEKIAGYYGPGGNAGEPCRQQQRWATNPQTGRPQGHDLNFMDAVASFVPNTTGGGPSQPRNMPLLAAEASVQNVKVL